MCHVVPLDFLGPSVFRDRAVLVMPHSEPSVFRVGQRGTDDVTQGGLLQVHDLL